MSRKDGAECEGGQEKTENVSKQSQEKTSVPTGFTVLGGFESKAPQKVRPDDVIVLKLGSGGLK